MWGTLWWLQPWLRMGWTGLYYIRGLHEDCERRAYSARPHRPLWGQHCTDPTPPCLSTTDLQSGLLHVYKWYNSWNVCFLCGFDVKYGHTFLSCPFKKLNHQQLCTQENVQQFIVMGYNPCTQGMHKLVLPSRRNTWRCGEENMFLANKCKKLISA